MSDVLTEKTARIESGVERLEAGVRDLGNRVLAVEGSLSSLESHSRETATASMKMATIAEERYRAEKEEREARIRREELAAEREAEMKGRAISWFLENWKGIGLAALFVLNPASLGKLYELGLLSPLGLAPVSAVQQPGIPQPVQVAPSPVPLLPPAPPTSDG